MVFFPSATFLKYILPSAVVIFCHPSGRGAPLIDVMSWRMSVTAEGVADSFSGGRGSTVNVTVLERWPTNRKVSSPSKGSQKEHVPCISELNDVQRLGTERSPTRSPTFSRTHRPSNLYWLARRLSLRVCVPVNTLIDLDDILIEILDSRPTFLGYRSAEKKYIQGNGIDQ